MKSINKEFVQLEFFLLCFHAESMEGFWIVSAILQSKPMPHLWLYNKLWCFVLVAEYTLMVWENNLFSFDFWLRASFYWSLCKGEFEPGSQFQPHFAQPLPKMVRKPNWDCPSPLHRRCACIANVNISTRGNKFRISFEGGKQQLVRCSGSAL